MSKQLTFLPDPRPDLYPRAAPRLVPKTPARRDSPAPTRAGGGGDAPPLLPCPFCGGAPQHWQNGLLFYSHVIRCAHLRCPAGYVCAEGPTLAEAARRWNTRTSTAKEVAE
ncbi:MAG: Lar family restriction alleviation protein [Porticoccaceae bacterium]|nr:Lar family restriction alleviation protein [Porticoccaceae bacterium]